MLLLGQRPLTASDADSDLFADRSDELKRVCRALDLGLNVYLWGPRGSGRTSLFHQVQRLLPDSKYVRLEGFKNLAERLDEIERVVRGERLLQREERVRRDSPLDVWPLAPRHEIQTVTVAEDPLRRLRAAAEAETDTDRPRQLLLVDDLSSRGLNEMFGRLRDNMWELPLQWVVAGESGHLSPPSDTFFDVSIELAPLDREGLEELLRRRASSGTRQEESRLLEVAQAALEPIAPCTPRRALAVLRDLYLSDDAAELTSELSRVQAAREHLKPTANTVLEALMAHGPVHAGDERLLGEVGVTRSRIVQVLSELEAQGLVSTQRVGRRKLYSAAIGGEPDSRRGEQETAELPT